MAATESQEGDLMRILPLRNMVLVRFQDEVMESPSGLQLVRDPRAIRPALVLACGPEVRDLKPDMIALVNQVAGTQIGEQLLIPESAIVGTIP